MPSSSLKGKRVVISVEQRELVFQLLRPQPQPGAKVWAAGPLTGPYRQGYRCG